ncbi:MAG TPA: transcriptional repressor [Sedimentisphaerales bacterium]|nr:transcriptional repressor [Sedimentisphaerales bacterium]
MRTQLDLKARRMLKSAKLYLTAGRVSVLQTLLKADKPLTQEQISGRLGKKRFDKVTIYRTLETLVKVGLVHRAFIEERARHFELAHNCGETQCHPHFTCTNCGRTHCLTDMTIPGVKKRHKGFLIHRQQTRFEGLCPACA